jgi:hypothetical protein
MRQIKHLFFAAAAVVSLTGFGDQKSVRVSDFGFDKEDSTRFVKAAFESKAERIVFDKRPEGPWCVTPLRIRSRRNVEIIFDDGAELCAKRGAFRSIFDALLTFDCCTNVLLHGAGRIRMWKEDYIRPPYKKSEWRHALSLLSCKDVAVEDLEITDSGGDGVYVSYVDTTHRPSASGYCENVVLRNVKCLRNCRQGVSVIAVKGFLAEGCDFSDTSGTLPEAGIDFEPNKPEDLISDCIINNCRFERNKGAGVLIMLLNHDATTPFTSIELKECVSKNNTRSFQAIEYTGRGQLRGGSGRIAVSNCTFREKDSVDKVVSKEIVYGRPVLAADGRRLTAISADEWDRENIKAVDACPGKRVSLNRTHLRYVTTFVFLASAPGTVSFKAKQGSFAKGQASRTNRIVITSFDGGFKTFAPPPSVTGDVFTVDVPRAGFYTMKWNTGYTSYFTLLESSVPVAIDALSRKIARPPKFHSPGSTVYFYVPKQSSSFAAVALGGDPGEGHRVTVKDPDGNTVFDRDNAECDDFWLSPENPDSGLWSFTSSAPSAKIYDDYGFDLAGIPPLFFLSREKYWIPAK